MMRSFGAEQDAALFHALDDVCRFPIRRLQRLRVANEFDTEEETGSARLPDDWVLGLQLLQALHPMVAGIEGVALQVVIGDDVEYLQADRAGDRVAAEGVEVFHAVVEGGGDCRCGDNSAQRVSIGDRLAHSDDIGNDAAQLERPEVTADAAEARLHFVGDADAAGSSHDVIGAFEIISRVRHLTATAHDALGKERG